MQSTIDAIGGAAADMAPACISAISRKHLSTRSLHDSLIGENLYIYQNYTEFRPLEPDMNVSRKNVKGFTPDDQKTWKDWNRLHELHYNYKKNRYGFKPDLSNYHLVDEKYHEIIPTPEPTPLEKAQYLSQLNSESRIYTQKKSDDLTERAKRGLVTKVSQRSSTRLKKFLARVQRLDLWIDFTYPDDVMKEKTLAERRDFSNKCLDKLKRYLHSLKLQEVWKKEYQARKSGLLEGKHIPHYHIAITGLSDKQKRNWQMLCIKILTKWVNIIGTDDIGKALKVACHRKSFRIIQSSRQAISYIGKYFSKTDEVLDENGEAISIGRAWGYAKSLKDGFLDPHHLFLNRNQSLRFRRFMRRYKKLKRNKKFIGAYEQITKGYSTYLFACEDTILRFLLSIGVDIRQVEGVPF